MRASKYIDGENNRVAIIKCLSGKQLTTKAIGEEIGIERHKVEHYLKRLVHEGYVQRIKMGGNRIEFKLDAYARYTPKDMSRYEEMQNKQKKEIEQEEDPQPTVPHARIVKLSNRNMQPPYRRGKSRSNTGLKMGMQSSMSMFNVL